MEINKETFTELICNEETNEVLLNSEKKNCTIHDTLGDWSQSGCIINHRVFSLYEGELELPKELFLHDYCDGGLAPFEVENKWGFVDIYSGNIIIEPIYDYATSFYKGYAHVKIGGSASAYDVERGLADGGKHGIIDFTGKAIIPLEYYFIKNYWVSGYFEVCKDKKWGVVDNNHKFVVPMQYDDIDFCRNDTLVFAGIREYHKIPEEEQYEYSIIACGYTLATSTNKYTTKWGVYNKDFTMLIPIELDEEPFIPSIKGQYYEQCYILMKNNKYGLLSYTGEIIEEIKLNKRELTKAIARFLNIEIRNSRSIKKPIFQ